VLSLSKHRPLLQEKNEPLDFAQGEPFRLKLPAKGQCFDKLSANRMDTGAGIPF